MAETTTKPQRQQFTGRDDVLLFERMERMAPWSYHGGVMSAWKQIADALNSDPECTMTGLNATSCRARFHRMVTQRKEGQDKMLRRGVTSEGEYELKMAKLDALIANMDGDLEKMAQFDALYDQLMKDTLPVQAPVRGNHAGAIESCAAPPVVPRQEAPRPQQRVVTPVIETQPRVQYQGHGVAAQPVVDAVVRSPNASMNVAASTCTMPSTANETARVYSHRPPATVIPMDVHVAHRNLKRPAEACAPTPMPTKRVAAPSKPAASEGTNDIGRLITAAERAVELLVRKIEQDQDMATAERQWRREQARAHREIMEALEQQTNQLKTIALECQWKGL